MRVHYKIVFWLLIFALLSACKGEFNESATKINITSEIEMSIAEIDSDYYAKEVLESDMSIYDDYRFFLMRLKSNGPFAPELSGVKNKDDIGRMTKYFIEDIKKDVHLVNSSDTLKCLDVHWERTYDLSNSITLNILFENSEKDYDEFIWNDKVFSSNEIKIKLEEI